MNIVSLRIQKNIIAQLIIFCTFLLYSIYIQANQNIKNIDLETMVLPNPRLMRIGGGADTGGGTLIQFAGASPILWDLFGTILPEPVPLGDRVLSHSSKKIERYNYVNLKAFSFLKSALTILSSKVPNLYQMISADDFMISPTTLDLFLVNEYPVQVQELYSQYDLSFEGLSVIPVAHFDKMTGYIFLNRQLWNKMDLLSQAAFILHERLRQIQTKYSLENDLIQGIVNFVILKYNEPYYWYYESPNDYYFYVGQQRPLNFKKSISPEKFYRRLLDKNQFLSRPSEYQKIITTGKNNFKNTDHEEILVNGGTDPGQCFSLITGLEPVVNSYRRNLYCSELGYIEGTGQLNFSTPTKKKKTIIEIEAALNSPNDGGSSFDFQLLKSRLGTAELSLQFRSKGYLEFYSPSNFDFEPSAKALLNTLSWQDLAKFNSYKFEIDYFSKKMNVYFKQYGKSYFLLGQVSLSKELLRGDSLYWSHQSFNNVTIKLIQISQ